jgi:hypothetical protein
LKHFIFASFFLLCSLSAIADCYIQHEPETINIKTCDVKKIEAVAESMISLWALSNTKIKFVEVMPKREQTHAKKEGWANIPKTTTSTYSYTLENNLMRREMNVKGVLVTEQLAFKRDLVTVTLLDWKGPCSRAERFLIRLKNVPGTYRKITTQSMQGW